MAGLVQALEYVAAGRHWTRKSERNSELATIGPAVHRPNHLQVLNDWSVRGRIHRHAYPSKIAIGTKGMSHSITDPNLNAFLDMLAWSEGTSTSPATADNGYDVIVTGVDGTPEVFTGFTSHPFANGRPSKVINSRGLTSNASGRYQFMLRDWAHYRQQLNLPDFGPSSQDRWACQLIRERQALMDISNGNIASAITKCSNIWASLPGNAYGQPVRPITGLLAQYTAAGGKLS